MKRFLKIISILIAVGFVAIQFVRIERTNPPIDPSLTIETHLSVPADVQMLMARSCNDCHSHKTVYPWYSNVAPVSWWLRDHIDHGRSHLNFSEWGKLDAASQKHKLEEICEEVRDRKMPLPSYTWGHRDAVLDDLEIETICRWTGGE